MNKQLLPCPFCGGEAGVFTSAALYFIQCNGCGCKTTLFVNEEMVTARWNTRLEIKERGKSRGTFDEVSTYCKSLNLPESDAVYFFNKCEGNGWMNGNHKIKDWRATIRSWKAAGYMPSCKQSAVSTPPRGQIPHWKQIQTIEEQLETHPANPSFRGYRADKVTPEQKEHYENQKANLLRLKGELI